MKKLILSVFAVLALAAVTHAAPSGYTFASDFDPSVQLCWDVFNSSDTVPAAAQKKIYQRAPVGFTAKSWTMTADQSGSAAVAIWKDTLANFPPTSADLITTSTPSATSVLWSSGTTSGWSTSSIKQGDVLDLNIVSIASWTRFQLCILGVKD